VLESGSERPDRENGASSTERPSGRARTVLDGDGVTWLVFERRIDGVSYLFFEAPHAFRRVKDYPREWMRLSDDLLVHLSWTR
jgi:hypothetical protein